MAYGLKYELLCKSKKGNLYRAKILFDGYAGAQIDRNVPLSPFKMRKDKAAVVRGTSFEFSIREAVDFEFLEFYSNNVKKIKVELYNPANALIWTGYNLPQQYQVPYIPAPANIMFTATDGLGLLKNEKFNLTGRKSQLEIIVYCINKIGLGLGYSIAINLFETSHNELVTPLAQTYEDGNIYSDLNCYEILEKVLEKYSAEITQRRGRWAITREADKKSVRMLYTSAGVYEGGETGPAVLNLGIKGVAGVDVWPRGSLSMSVEPGGKEVVIKHGYGRKDSFLSNPAFETGWTIDGNFVPEARFNNNGAYLFIPERNNVEQFYVSSVDIENAPGDDFVFSVQMAAIGSKLYGGLPIPVLMAVTMIIEFRSGAETRWLTEGGWSASAGNITKSVASVIGGEPRFNPITIITAGLPFATGTFVVYLGRYHSMHEVNDSSWTIGGIAWADVKCYFTKAGQLYVDGVEMLASFSNSSEPGNLSDINLLAADAPALPNAKILYRNIMFLLNGGITALWHVLGSIFNYSMLQQMALSLASFNRKGRQKLTGDIKGNGIAFDSIIKHAYNSNREFEIAEGIWDIYEEVFSVTLLELLAWSDETVVFSAVPSTGGGGGSVSSGGGGGTTGGVPGPIGPQGATGLPGPQGIQGFTGADSAVPGPTGPQGATGLTGPQGIQGFTGLTGPQGPQGATGLPGPQGIQGFTGADSAVPGPTGPQGATGLPGPQGIQGFTGADSAVPGPTGPQGATGLTGPQGIQGFTGLTGPQGPQGATGLPGPQGIQGFTGADSAVPGPTGPQGATGLTGPQGIQGFTGADSAVPGPQGPTGPQGPIGTINVTSGTAPPSGGSNGDVYFQYIA